MALFAKNLLFTVLVPGTVAVYVPLAISDGDALAGGLRLAAALALLGGGGAVYTWCVWDFAHRGRGTPAPVDAPRRLVVAGLYRHVRNPMYVGVLGVILGWAVAFRSTELVLYAVGVGACFHAFVRLYEEPHLRRVFGTDYEAYCRRVGRWLPRLR